MVLVRLFFVFLNQIRNLIQSKHCFSRSSSKCKFSYNGFNYRLTCPSLIPDLLGLKSGLFFGMNRMQATMTLNRTPSLKNMEILKLNQYDTEDLVYTFVISFYFSISATIIYEQYVSMYQ